MEQWRAVNDHNGGTEDKMEYWRVGIAEVADSHYFDEDPD